MRIAVEMPKVDMSYYDKVGPLELIVLQGTTLCNLDCEYCYLTSESRRKQAVFPLETLQVCFEKLLVSGIIGDRLEIIWHAGEPLTLPIAYYQASFDLLIALKNRYLGKEFPLKFSIQTNGILLNQAWCDFFLRYKDCLALGISIDGPAFIHDKSRKNWQGEGSFDNTLRGLELLIKNKITFGLIAVVTSDTLLYPDEFFDFFYRYKDVYAGFHYNLEEPSANNPEYKMDESAHQNYFKFVQRLLDRLQAAPDNMHIGNFYQFWCTLAFLQEHSNIAGVRTYPFKILNLDVNANVSTFFAGMGLSTDDPLNVYGDNNGFMIGNLEKQSVEEIIQSAKLKQMKQDFELSYATCEKECEYFTVCGGGYPVRKYIEHGTFAASETRVCKIQLKTFADAVVQHVNTYLTAS